MNRLEYKRNWKREARESLHANGLRSDGKPRINRMRDELLKYKWNLKLYHRMYMRLARTGTTAPNLNCHKTKS